MDSTLPLIAAQYLGGTVAPLDPSLSARDSAYLIKLMNPKMIFVSPEATMLIEKACAEAKCEPEIVVLGPTDRYTKFSEFLRSTHDEILFKPIRVADLQQAAFINFSSGTTGLPKGIKLSHHGILYAQDSIRFAFS